MIQKYYRFIHTSSEIRSNSSSGGAFTLISDSFLKQDGVLYGCVFSEGLKTIHIRAITETGKNRMRKAKYIQSDMRDAFSCIESDLKVNRRVPFSGTPCQVSAVMHYLNKKKIDMSNLLLLEVVCHGVGSNR